MKSEIFFCVDCQKTFDIPTFFEEKHGLDGPPYERIAVCPKCRGNNILKFDALIEKTEVAERLIPCIMSLNKYVNAIKDVFGLEVKNIDLDESVDILAEFINEMFCFVDSDVQRKIFEMDSEDDVQTILMHLRGEL